MLQMLMIVLRQKVVVNQLALFSLVVVSQAILSQMEVVVHWVFKNDLPPTATCVGQGR